MKLVSITKAIDGKHKYTAVFAEPRKTVHFGQAGASDYTINKDEQRKENYISRHKSRENWNDPTTAGALAYHLLWSEKSFKTALSKFKKRFNL